VPIIVIERETLEEGLMTLSEMLVGKCFEHSKTVAIDERVYLMDRPGDFDEAAAALIAEALAKS
jgi:hypothetical protein